MVTIKFRSFAEYKEYITSLGVQNPNRAAPYRFHSITGSGTTVEKVVEIGMGGHVVFLYDSPSSEVIKPDDDWFKANSEMNYPASILVADITEAM